MSQHCSNTSSSEGEAADNLRLRIRSLANISNYQTNVSAGSVPDPQIWRNRIGHHRAAFSASSSSSTVIPPPEIRIYEPCLDDAVSPDDKSSWYRQHPGIVALIIGKHSTI